MKLNIVIVPGDQIELLLGHEGTNEAYPVVAMVLRVHRGALVVPDPDSRNGLAKIVCHGDSGSTGEYWYEYVDNESKSPSLDVVKLLTINGQEVRVSSFIED